MAQPLPESWQPYAEGALHFDAASHTYTLSGARVPSVTQILALAGLVDLRDIPAHILEHARLKGEYVHRACEFLDQGDLDLATLDPQLTGYVQAWVRCKEERALQVVEVERPVYYQGDEGTYAGTLDRLVLIEGEVPAVLDLKSGSRLQPTTALQVEAYVHARVWMDRHAAPRPKRIAVRLCADSTYEWKEYADEADGTTFLAALRLAHWRLAHDAKARRT